MADEGKGLRRLLILRQQRNPLLRKEKVGKEIDSCFRCRA
ncbi:hypothetical protein M3J09_011291 [Ascochyta lentis]